jgi:hypothetical protein
MFTSFCASRCPRGFQEQAQSSSSSGIIYFLAIVSCLYARIITAHTHTHTSPKRPQILSSPKFSPERLQAVWKLGHGGLSITNVWIGSARLAVFNLLGSTKEVFAAGHGVMNSKNWRQVLQIESHQNCRIYSSRLNNNTN